MSANPPYSSGQSRTVHIRDRAYSEDVSNDVEASKSDRRATGTNRITTTKYTIFSWLPVSFFDQFRRAANIYFLAISILMLLGTYVPELFHSPLEPYSTLGTLIFVMMLTSIREAVEDLKRFGSDKIENRRAVERLELYDGAFKLKTVRCEDLRSGDIVRLKRDDAVPCDIVMILSKNQEEDSCSCYIETSNIDGETNLKLKEVPDGVYQALKGKDTIDELRARIVCEPPNDKIHTFCGTFEWKDASKGSPVSLCADNFILRGSSLKNTQWVLGVAIYTGKDTKIMKNAKHPPSKLSSIEASVNQATYIIFTAQCILVTLSVFLESMVSEENHTYLHTGEESSVLPEAIAYWFIFLILFNNFIPISLYVTLEIINVLQAYLISSDLEMYCQELDLPANVRASNLSQDIGRVQYVFSDKTGTLTRNVMEFRSCAIGKTIFTEDESKHNIYRPCQDMRIEMKRGSQLGSLLTEYYVCILCCSTLVIADVKEADGSPRYESESPDEVALAEAAKKYGCQLQKRSNSEIVIQVMDEVLSFTPLAMNQFNSKRKRMSALVKSHKTNEYILYVKGADNVMLQLSNLTVEEKTAYIEHLGTFAVDGLRTLVMAKRVISENDANEWMTVYQAGRRAIEDRQEKLDMIAETIEGNLTVIGVSAIEDKLQKGVPDAIQSLMEAGIKVWVLTGDKVETAINICHSCRLLKDEVDLYKVINKDNGQAVELELCRIVQEIDKKVKARKRPNVIRQMTKRVLQVFTKEVEVLPSEEFTANGKSRDHIGLSVEVGDAEDSDRALALVIDGESLMHVLSSDAATRIFLELSSLCSSVICSRVSPLQKAQVVNLIKNTDERPITLSIGDGANDVGMILEAHIGIGISGLEGRQAVNNSDIAIAQFRYLKRLLLVHGRWNYIRTCIAFLYSMHKNIVLTLILFWYSSMNMYSASSFFESIIYTAFNILLGLPIIFYGALNKDISAEYAIDDPRVYLIGRKNMLLSTRAVVLWMTNALLYTICISVTSYYILDFSTYSLYALGTLIYTALVTALHSKIFVFMNNWTIAQVAILLLSIVAPIPLLYLYDMTNAFEGEMSFLGSQCVYWFAAFFMIPSFCMLIDLVGFVIQREINPSFTHMAIEDYSLNHSTYTDFIVHPRSKEEA